MSEIQTKAIKYSLRIFQLFLIMTVVVLGHLFFRNSLVSAQEQIKIFPTRVEGEWQNPEAVLIQDLEANSSFEEFNSENSAYPLEILEIVPEETITALEEEIIPPAEQEPLLEEEIPAEETHAEEIPIEEIIEEVPTEEIIEEEIVEETLIEEIPVEEAPIEEIPTEEVIEDGGIEEPIEEFEPVSFWNKVKNLFREVVWAQEEDVPTEEEDVPTEEGDVSTEEGDVSTEEGDVSTEEGDVSTEEGDVQIEQEALDIPDKKTLILSDFSIGDSLKEEEIDSVVLRISLAASGSSGGRLSIQYYFQDSWHNLEVLSLENQISNSSNGDYFSYNLPVLIWKNLESFKVKFIIHNSNEVYLDSCWLEIETKITDSTLSTQDSIALRPIKKDWKRNEDPEFIIDGLPPQRSDLIAQMLLALRKKEITAVLIDSDGGQSSDNIIIQNDRIKVSQSEKRGFKPGLYKLRITTNKNGEEIVQEEEFTWGALAINFNKSIYLPNEQAYLQMGVLDDIGHTICDADLRLEIISPDGQTSYPQAQRSGKCKGDNVVDVPDYFAYYSVLGVGNYQVKLTATTVNGVREITDQFEVRDSVPFDVERIGPTRIYPPAIYQVTFRIKTNQDFQGQIREYVPDSFIIIAMGDAKQEVRNEERIIMWQVNWGVGETHELSYRFDAPDISPYLYLLGPLKVGSFQETRQWQIASDAEYLSNASFTGGTIDWTLSIAIYDAAYYQDTAGSTKTATEVGRNNTALGSTEQTISTNINSSDTVILDLYWSKQSVAVDCEWNNISADIAKPSDPVTWVPIWSDTSIPAFGDPTAWAALSSLDVSSYFDETGQYKIRYYADLSNINNTSAQCLAWFDNTGLDVTVSATPTLTFSISDVDIGFGTLSTSANTYATGDTDGSASEVSAHTLIAATNSTSGYTITVKGDTLEYSTYSIEAIGGTAAAPNGGGTEQFGINLVYSGGSGTATAPYNDQTSVYDLAYAATDSTADEVASSAGASTDTTYSVYYLANISTLTEAGIYTANLTYICTGNF